MKTTIWFLVWGFVSGLVGYLVGYKYGRSYESETDRVSNDLKRIQEQYFREMLDQAQEESKQLRSKGMR